MNKGTCKHYTGSWHNTHCAAGVCYRDVTTDPDDINGVALRQPCIIWADRDWDNQSQKENYARRGSCEKFELPTKAELKADKDRMDKRFAEVMESLEKGIVPEGVMVCGPGTVGSCKCNCPESCEHIWDGERIEDEQVATATCSRCGKWAINHDIWVEV